MNVRQVEVENTCKANTALVFKFVDKTNQMKSDFETEFKDFFTMRRRWKGDF